jgi:putative ABC transport system permease protein
MIGRFSLTRLIAASILHKPGRNLATVFCFAFIAANIFSAQYLVAGTAGTIDEGVSRMGADLLVIPSQYSLLIRGNQMGPVSAGTIIRVEPSSMRINASLMDAIGRVPDVSSMSPQLYVASLGVPALSASPVDIYGIDPVTDFTVTPWLPEPPEKAPGHGEIIVGSALAGEGTTSVQIGTEMYTVTGRLDPTQSAVDHSVFMTLDDAYALAAEPGVLPPSAPAILPGTVNAILVQAAPGTDPSMVGARIQQPLPSTLIKVLERHTALKPASKAAQGLPALFSTLSLVVTLAAFPLIALIAAMVAHERRREIGLLIAMGAKRSRVFLIVMAESLVLGIAGGLAGVGVSLAAFSFAGGGGSILFLQGFQVPSVGETGMMAAIAIAIVILVTGLASLWPAWRSSRMNPWDAIRSNE